MKTEDIINIAINHLRNLPGHEFDLLTISKPISSDAAVNLAKAISKLSPILGNLIEFNIVEFLNNYEEFSHFGQ
jgi:hypothetical protein